MIPSEYFDVLSVLHMATSHVTFCWRILGGLGNIYASMQGTLQRRKWKHPFKVLHNFPSNVWAHLIFMLSCIDDVPHLQRHTCSRGDGNTVFIEVYIVLTPHYERAKCSKLKTI